MKWRFAVRVGVFAVFTVVMAGCGGNGGGSSSESVAASAASCISCHDPVISPVTGLNIVTEWQASAHGTAGAASCYDCHEPDPSHPSNCNQCHGGGTLSANSARHDVTLNPDASNPDESQSGKSGCYKCHAETATVYPLGTGKNHFDAPISADLLGSNVEEATYVGAQNTTRCRGCHNPHDNRLLPQHTDWAASGHGDTTATPWRHYPYNTYSSGSCNRCHTATGFVNYLVTGVTASFGQSTDRHELLRCDGCHLDYSWKRRDGKTIGYAGVKVPYSSFTETTVVFPDAGNSNLCTNCHSGRVSGKKIADALDTAKTSNFGSYNSHYFAAGGNLFAKIGYEYRTHADYLPIFGVNIFEHDQIGVNDTTVVGGAPSHVINLGTTRGPCVGCHMFNKSHALAPVTLAGSPVTTRDKINAAIDTFPAFTEVCFKCHTPGGAYDLSFGGTADIRTLKAEYRTRLAEIEAKLQALPNGVKIYYNPDKYPYFFANSASTSSFTNWDGPYPAQWRHTLGAAFNLNLCFRDPGGYAHNHRYTERLIYDSLDFLDDGDPNNGSYVSAGFPAGRPL